MDRACRWYLWTIFQYTEAWLTMCSLTYKLASFITYTNFSNMYCLIPSQNSNSNSNSKHISSFILTLLVSTSELTNECSGPALHSNLFIGRHENLFKFLIDGFILFLNLQSVLFSISRSNEGYFFIH